MKKEKRYKRRKGGFSMETSFFFKVSRNPNTVDDKESTQNEESDTKVEE